MAKVSVILPSRNEIFLGKTIEDLLAKAAGEIEVIAILDGYWPNPPLKDHPNVTLIHRSKPHGMRPGINAAASIAKGKYLMKLDAHCMVGEGFDEILQKDCEKDWIAVPTKYSLDAENWRNKPDKAPINYYYLTFPYFLDGTYGTGLHAKWWREKEKDREGHKVDDLMSSQGSCWFMHKSHFEKIGPMDHENYYFYQEFQEIGMKTWISGGRCVVNKNTWYSHLHKGKQYGRGFYLSKERAVGSEMFSMDYWMNDRYPGAVRTMKSFVEQFWPLPTWPQDWEDPRYRENFVHPWHAQAHA